MLLISLSSRGLTKHLYLIAVGIVFGSATCFAQSMFLSVPSTPYDRQMNRVAQVLNSPGRQWPGLNSVTLVNYWLGNLRAMPYRFSRRWKRPDEIRSNHEADCKGKAVALYQLMRVNGARNVRLIIGKHRSGDLKTHAWVQWETQYGTYLLDPTFNWTAIRPEERDPNMYIPFYAYDGVHKYCANNYLPLYPTAVAQY